MVASAALVMPAAYADTAADYDLFVLGDMHSVGSDTEGRVAVGGNAYLQNYSVGAVLQNPAGYSLVVGGNLTANGGSTNGGMVVGGTSSFSSWSMAGLAPAGTALPVDFSAEAIRLKALSATLAGYTVNGTTSYQNWGAPDGTHSYQITFTGANAGLNVFTVDGAKLSDGNTFTLDLAAGATALINVTGITNAISGGFAFGNPANVLWNFADTTSLSFKWTNMTGSVLAPKADYHGSAPIAGQLIVGSFTGQDWQVTQVNLGRFEGGLLDGGDAAMPSVPEPASWLTMLVGFGMLGTVLRRRSAVRLA